MKKQLSLLAMILFLPHAASDGEIYKWTDAEGKVYYSDVPKDQTSERVYLHHPNIAEPIKIVEPREDKKSESKNPKVKPVPELTERQKRLEEERAAEQKCQRYYGVSCSAVSRMLERWQSTDVRITPQTPEHRARVSGNEKKRGINGLH